VPGILADRRNGVNQYKMLALQDVLSFYTALILQDYESEKELEEALKKEDYDNRLFFENAGKDGDCGFIILRLEKGEAKVMFCEDSTWVVWFVDILERWYRENKDFFDKEVARMLAS
jgi:hypothetical protein